jgi:cytochrome oxidase Cu insertion factor (SCO1/SenC/PrrC family)
MRRIPLFLLMVAGLGWWRGPVGLAAPPSAQVDVGKAAPDFTLTLLSGEKFQLTTLQGKVVVLNFWASW